MKKNLVDFKVNVRIRLAALWTAVMFCYLYGDYFELYVPHKVEELLTGHNLLDNPFRLFFATFILTIPALMIFLSLVLSPLVTKYLNIGVGIFFTLFTLVVGLTSLSEWRMFYLFLSIVESMLTAIVAWQALHWERLDPDAIKEPY